MTSQVSALDEAIAEIRLNPETRKIADISFFRRDLRFKCQRCAVFCCKLGGPRLSEVDTERLRRAGCEPMDFLDVATERRSELENAGGFAMKQREDGSCVFLECGNVGKTYSCSVYESRPALCRLYPFEFKRTGLNTVLLRVIPCCKGLNACDGALVDRGFVEKRLLGVILDLF